jgi:hypothetical protein
MALALSSRQAPAAGQEAEEKVFAGETPYARTMVVSLICGG